MKAESKSVREHIRSTRFMRAEFRYVRIETRFEILRFYLVHLRLTCYFLYRGFESIMLSYLQVRMDNTVYSV